MISEEAAGWSDDRGGDAVVPVTGLVAPAPLGQRGAAPPSGDELLRSTSYARSHDRDSAQPDPLPWHPQGSSDRRDKASSESDGTR
ncbi:hypothetical protein WMF30_16925 [Sorangium sp. So ce134]